MLLRALAWILALCGIVVGISRLQKMAAVPAQHDGDIRSVLVDKEGRPDPKLSEAFKSVAESIEKNRSDNISLAQGSLAGLDNHARGELAEELIAQLNEPNLDRSEVVRNYFQGIRPDEFWHKQQVLNTLKASGEEWSPLYREIAMRVLEYPNLTPQSSVEEANLMHQAAEAFRGQDASAKWKLWEQVKILHPQREVLIEIAGGLGIQVNDIQNPEEALESNEHE